MWATAHPLPRVLLLAGSLAPFPQCVRMLVSERHQWRIAGGFCVGALCCILIAGLWPFGHPPNDVTWLANQPGVRLGKRATILSSKPLPGLKSPACSVEMWLRPRLNDASSTALDFSGSNGIHGLSIHQSWTDLRLDSDAARGTAKIVRWRRLSGVKARVPDRCFWASRNRCFSGRSFGSTSPRSEVPLVALCLL